MSTNNDLPKPTPSATLKGGAKMKLKVCGMKYPENIDAVARLQPDYLGFIFYEKSSRFVKDSIPKLPSSIKKTGVFVDAPIEEIVEKFEKYDLDLVQLHGDETPGFCLELKRHRLPPYARNDREINIIKVFPIQDHFNFDLLKPYESVCDYFLFDTKGKLPGGNGYSFNWEVLKDYPSTKPYFLSGGIGMEEVENISKFLRRQESQFCHAIDVNSKFEIAPGLKDTEKLALFKQEINKFQKVDWT